jgi:hypothetical protein
MLVKKKTVKLCKNYQFRANLHIIIDIAGLENLKRFLDKKKKKKNVENLKFNNN